MPAPGARRCGDPFPARCTLSASAETSLRQAEPPVAIEITARPIGAFEPRDPARMRFGPLTFRGGLSLTSSYREFGGVSSIRVGADGARFLAVTDKGRWLRGRIVYDGHAADRNRRCRDGADPRRRRQAARGARLVRHRIDRRGRRHGLRRHRARATASCGSTIGRDGLLARGTPIAVPPAFARLPNNKGIECLVFVPQGRRSPAP